MKKPLLLTLALAFVLGTAGTALAANPFTDIPANHWAYASVGKLAATGIIDGYGDGTFAGAKTMTRYEMAQIVAKAMTKSDKMDNAMKSQIEKLAAEFASELDTLGVRVAKLEKNADNVKITGEIRIGDWQYGNNALKDKDQLRNRLWLRGQVNENWSYTGMIEQLADLRTNSNNDNATRLRRAWVDGKLGDFTLTAGRFSYAPVYGLVFDQDADGLKLSYVKDNVKADIFLMRPSFANPGIYVNQGTETERNQVAGAAFNLGLGKNVDLSAAYFHTEGMNDAISNINNNINIYELALTFKLSKNFSLWGEYLRGDKNVNDGGKNGWAVRADYGKANRSKPGTYNIHAGYYDQPASTMINSTHELNFADYTWPDGASFDGYKGWKAAVRFVVAKNIDLNFEYYDFEQQKGANDTNLAWSYLRFFF